MRLVITLALTFYAANAYLPSLTLDRENLDATVLEDIVFDEVTTEFYGSDSESFQIGWKRIAYCKAGNSHQNPASFAEIQLKFVGVDDPTSHELYNKLAPYAITFKIIPEAGDGEDPPTEDEYKSAALYGKTCEPPTILLNNGYQLPCNGVVGGDGYCRADGYYSPEETSPGMIAASNDPGTYCRLAAGGGGCGYKFEQSGKFIAIPYNGPGYHIKSGYCQFAGIDYSGNRGWDYSPTENIAIYLGFDLGRSKICKGYYNRGEFININPCNGFVCPDDGNPCTETECQVVNNEAQCVTINKADDTSCSDTDLCNGNEVCMAGVCQAGIAVSCGFGEECISDSGLCVPQCSAFDIDTFAGTCSSTIPTVSQVDLVKQNIVELEAELEAVNARIDGLSINVPPLDASQSSASSTTPSSQIFIFDKDTLIAVSLIGNMVLFMVILCCMVNGRWKKDNSKYKSVAVYSSEEENKPINNI